MKTKITIGVLAILMIIIGMAIILLINKDNNLLSTPSFKDRTAVSVTISPSDTKNSSPTATPTNTPIITYYMVCTPPLCAINTDEAYYCPVNCPGGCGTTCATYTPTP